MEGTDKLLERIKDCAFDIDATGNMSKAKELLQMKLKIEKKLFELNQRFDIEKGKLIISEEIQKKGKNEASRKALIDLELAGTDYNKIALYKMMLASISSVERYNGNVMDLFFRESK